MTVLGSFDEDPDIDKTEGVPDGGSVMVDTSFEGIVTVLPLERVVVDGPGIVTTEGGSVMMDTSLGEMVMVLPLGRVVVTPEGPPETVTTG